MPGLKIQFDLMYLGLATRTYPVYCPPNQQSEIGLPFDKANENFDHFCATLVPRMTAFQALMKTFGINATTEDQNLVHVSYWFMRYGGLLLECKPHSTKTLDAFVNYDPPWLGKLTGMNIIWDVGTYVGECIIAKRRNAYWTINTDPAARQALGFHRPRIAGLNWPTECDPITQVFNDSQVMCHNRRYGSSSRVVRSDLGNLVHLVTLWSNV